MRFYLLAFPYTEKIVLLKEGGILLAIRQHIPSLLLPSPDNLELLLVQVSSNFPFRLCLIYNPLNAVDNYKLDLIAFLQTIALDIKVKRVSSA